MQTPGRVTPAPRNPKPVRHLESFVDDLQATGRYTFRWKEALDVLGVGDRALRASARRLSAKGRLVMPRRGFLVIVPTEYRSAGAPPPAWFIDELMCFHEHPYYVGILSAAALHGAAHHQPQEFQVVTDTMLRPAQAGRSRIRFFSKRSLDKTATAEVKTPTGTLRVSTPEATAFDLLRYIRGAGGLGNVATVLSGLAEKIHPDALVDAARADAEIPHAQRLGCLLDRVGGKDKTEALAAWVSAQKPPRVVLRPGRPSRGFPLDRRWQVILNEPIEADL